MPLREDVELQEHQKRVRDAASQAAAAGQPYRVWLNWGTGSGKSLGALGIADALNSPSTSVIGPAALRPTLKAESARFLGHTNFPTYSYQAAAKDQIPPTDTLLMDEAQRLGSQTSLQSAKALELANKARNLVLMSATPVRNSPAEFAPFLEALTQKRMSQDDFRRKFIGSESHRPGGLIGWLRGTPRVETPTLKNVDELKELLKGKVDYYRPTTPPVDIKHEKVEAEMTPQQARLYQGTWGKLPWLLRQKLQWNYGMTPQELARARSFMTGPRQVALSDYAYRPDADPYKAFQNSGKLQKAFGMMQEKLKDERAKGIVYSNFMSGLVPYSAALTRNKIPNAIFHGGLSDEERNKLVKDFNTGSNLRVALVAPAGAEGISLKGSQLLQLLDKHWHKSRSDQAQARGIRFDSHKDLPADLRNITVQEFTSKLPLSTKDKIIQAMGINREHKRETVDDYLERLSERKEVLNRQLMDVIRDAATKTPVKAGMEKPAGLAIILAKLLASLGTQYTAALGGHLARKELIDPEDRQYLLPGLIGGGAAALLASPVISHYVSKAMKRDSPATAADIKRLHAASGLPKGLSVAQEHGLDNAYYAPPGTHLFETPEEQAYGNIAYGPDYKRKGVIAHEMGHASIQNQGSWLSRLNQNWLRGLDVGPGMLAAGVAAPIAGLTLGPLGGLAVGGLAGTLANAPTLINEYQASSRAMKNMAAAGYKQEEMDRARKALVPAWSTYLAGAALPAAALGGGIGLAKMLMSKGSADRTAVVIKGNPKYVTDNPQADRYYAALEKFLQGSGYNVSFDAGEPYTEPPPADLWLGHSRGAGRLRFAPPETRTIAVGSNQPGAINHPSDIVNAPPGSFTPPAAHYRLTPGMRRRLEQLLKSGVDGDLETLKAAADLTAFLPPPEAIIAYQGKQAAVSLSDADKATALAAMAGIEDPTGPPPITQLELKQVKTFSDLGTPEGFDNKSRLLRDLIRRRPDEWSIDDTRSQHVYGVRHRTGWRYHVPRRMVEDLITQPTPAA